MRIRREDLGALSPVAQRQVREQLDADARAELEVLRRQKIPGPEGGRKTKRFPHDSQCKWEFGYDCDCANRAKRPWSNAQPIVVDGIRFPSRMEARVYERLKRELGPGETLYRQYPIALTNLAPGRHGEVLRFTCDFAILRANGTWRFVEAKGARRSRDYPVRKAAAEKLRGPIEEVER